MSRVLTVYNSIMTDAKRAILDADVPTKGHFIFADGAHAIIKLEMDNLWDHPNELRVILDLLAGADGLATRSLGKLRAALECVTRAWST